MSTYSFENKKSVLVRVLSFHFAYGKMKTAIMLVGIASSSGLIIFQQQRSRRQHRQNLVPPKCVNLDDIFAGLALTWATDFKIRVTQFGEALAKDCAENTNRT